jgi:hypothetical protein
LKVVLVTFADGSKHWADASRRLSKNALSSGLFSSAEVWNLERIQRDAPDFWNKHEGILNRETRGFGYWLWKPFVILETLKRIGEHCDVLVYLDAGCSVNITTDEARERFKEYCQLTLESGGLAFQIHDQKELWWNKMDTVLKVAEDESILDSNQLVGGISMFTNVLESRKLLQRWLELGESESYHLIDDTPSRTPNDPSFIAHRHDQSVWSLLVKQSQFTILEDETYFGGSWSGDARQFPLWATRNSTGLAKGSDSIAVRVMRKIARMVRR